ncbi:MAG: nickel-dependent hydrogenase large subunit [Nanoarchaeota archaeon]|nr:nickel-dependent hydrogenase large subunit [Nanoarchaeota archaeon]
MTVKKVDISIQNLSKIEGHADLDVKVRDGKVTEVKLQLADNKRFFTQAIRGQTCDSLPQSVARICGTCSIAHTMGCIEAIERALKVPVSEQTKVLKKLTMYGLMIRDHALHVYLFSLPDVFEMDSVLDFQGEQAQYLKDSFVVKKAGNDLSTVVAGRAVHAPYPTVGGSTQIPKNEDLKALIPELKEARDRVMKVLGVYAKCKTNYERDTKFVALAGEEFNFLGDYILTSDGEKVLEEDYFEHLDKVVIPYSQALGYEFEDDTYMLGALARLNVNKGKLHANTKKDCAKYLKLFPSRNIFLNNMAQAIEIVHSIDHAIEIIQTTKFKPEEPPKLEYKDCSGVGVIEAPRGILYYKLFIKSDGTIKEGRIITPTQQNQINMELDIKKIVQSELNNGMSKEKIQYEMEKLIRAYDPCISCATHFLKVNWDFGEV